MSQVERELIRQIVRGESLVRTNRQIRAMVKDRAALEAWLEEVAASLRESTGPFRLPPETLPGDENESNN